MNIYTYCLFQSFVRSEDDLKKKEMFKVGLPLNELICIISYFMTTKVFRVVQCV